jgi:preprotein translocase subunit SecD
MLYFSRTKAVAILLTAFVVCCFSIPNFFSEETVKTWPTWAQGRLMLSPDLQGGTSALLEVDRSDVRAQLLQVLSRDVRTTLSDARITWANPPVVRGESVEVRLRESDFPAGFAELRELSRPVNGVSTVDVIDAGGGRVRLSPTEAAITEREQRSIDQSIPFIQGRMFVKATVEREGSRRILVQVPGLGDPARPSRIPGMLVFD